MGPLRITLIGASFGALGQLGRVLCVCARACVCVCVCVFVCLSLVLSFVQLFLPARSVPGRERRSFSEPPPLGVIMWARLA